MSSSWNAPGAQLFRQERKAEVSAAGLPTKDKKQGDVYKTIMYAHTHIYVFYVYMYISDIGHYTSNYVS